MSLIKYWGKYILLLLAVYLLNRISFLILHIDLFENIATTESLQALFKGYRLDLSIISYLFSTNLVLILLSRFFPFKGFNRIIKGMLLGLNLLVFLAISLINAGEAATYSEWITKLNVKVFDHLKNPSEVYRTASFSYMLIFYGFFLSQMLFCTYLYRMKIHREYKLESFTNSKTYFVQIGLCLLLILPTGYFIRGGFQPIPIQISDVYFSNHLPANDLAVNSSWSFLNSVWGNTRANHGNPYKKYSSEKADQIVQELYSTPIDSTSSILKNNRPNIVYIILEGWTADVIEKIGGMKNLSPNFNTLCDSGFLFKEYYSSGWTSDQGMSAIFSSEPVLPLATIVNQPDKYRKLPCLNKDLQKNGYTCSYLFGGQLTYGNIKSYLLDQGFDQVKDETDYEDDNYEAGKLGIHDHIMLDILHKETNKLPEPFLSCLFTLSTHSPFDIPVMPEVNATKHKEYLGTIKYADAAIGDFFLSIKNEAWYSNTLFVIMSDHSHPSPKGWGNSERNKFRIPLLFVGDVIKEEFKGKTSDKIASQLDLNKTILNQLNIPSDHYTWSKNLFNPYTPEFAPYAFHYGVGLIKSNAYHSLNVNYNKTYFKDDRDSAAYKKVKMESEAFFQKAFDHYLSY